VVTAPSTPRSLVGGTPPLTKQSSKRNNATETTSAASEQPNGANRCFLRACYRNACRPSPPGRLREVALEDRSQGGGARAAKEPTRSRGQKGQVFRKTFLAAPPVRGEASARCRLAGGKTGRDQQRCVHEVQPEPNLSRPSPEDFSEKPAPPAPWGVEMRDDLRKLGGRSPCPLAAPYLPPGGERGRQGAGQGAGRGQVSCPLMGPPETRRRPPLGEGLRDLDRAELLDDLLDVVVVSAALLVGPAEPQPGKPALAAPLGLPHVGAQLLRAGRLQAGVELRRGQREIHPVVAAPGLVVLVQQRPRDPVTLFADGVVVQPGPHRVCLPLELVGDASDARWLLERAPFHESPEPLYGHDQQPAQLVLGVHPALYIRVLVGDLVQEREDDPPPEESLGGVGGSRERVERAQHESSVPELERLPILLLGREHVAAGRPLEHFRFTEGFGVDVTGYVD